MSEDQSKRETERAQADRSELAERIGQDIPRDGKVEPQPGVCLGRVSSLGEPVHAVVEPSFCVIAQGSKDIELGPETFRYDPAHYLINTMQLPLTGEVVEATPQQPYLSFRLVLDPSVVTSVMVESGLGATGSEGGGLKAVDVSALDSGLLDATLRLVRLIDSPDDYRALSPLIIREITYRLLTGDQASRMRHMATLGGRTHRMARAVQKLREDFDKPLRVEDVAQQLGMSVSGFHAHFKAVTSMSPLQFQKHLRLHEARRLMLSDDCDAAQAGFHVGYDDPSHFSREYSRLFGAPPKRNIDGLRRRSGEIDAPPDAVSA